MKVSAVEKKENKVVWWVVWTATFLGFPIGGTIARALAGPVVDPLSGLFAGALAGTAIGLAQWLALRDVLTMPVAAKWGGATALGISLGLAASELFVGDRSGGLDLAIMGLVTGIGAGALQAWVLKDRISASWRWFLVTPPLWAVSWLITWAIGVDVSLRWAVFGSSGAIFYTVITGLALRFLLGETASVANGTNAAMPSKLEA